MNTNEFVRFHNWTDFDFTFPYGNRPFFFKAGSKITLSAGEAQHFAKHLVDEYLNRNKMKLDHHSRAELEQRCTEDAEMSSDIPADIQARNEQIESGVVSTEKTPKKAKKGGKSVDQQLEEEASKGADNTEGEFDES